MVEEFMTALLLVLLHLTLPRDQRAKSDVFQWTWKPRDSHITQVWLCFFTLSLLTVCIVATPVEDTEDLQTCLGDLKSAIEKSDAMLYSPPIEDMTDSCQHKVLHCYFLELIMIFTEEEFEEKQWSEMQCVFNFNHRLSPEKNCKECEVHPLKNSTAFFQGLMDTLKAIRSKG